jgi:hypothetical protein
MAQTSATRKTKKIKSTWGGAREGAGRPKTSAFVPHLTRPRVGKERPALITLKLRTAFEDIRNPEFFETFEKATLRARRFGLRIIHFSLIPKKILLWVEVKNQEQLEKSFKSLNTCLAVFLKKAFLKKSGLEHKGPVFLGRFEMQLLQSPEEARSALRKILLAPSEYFARKAYPDDYSSAPLFGAWKDLLEKNEKFEEFNFSADEINRTQRITSTPQFWLSQSGWRSEQRKQSKEKPRASTVLKEAAL